MGQKFTMGDLVPVDKRAAAALDLRLRIAAPSWVRPRQAMIYVNGRQVAKQSINAIANRPTDQMLNFAIDRPTHDAHVVAFVLGDAIKLPGWTTYGKATQAITNPIYLDIDGDEKYRSPRDTARRLISAIVGEQAELTQAQRTALLDSDAVKADPAVQIHVENLLKRDRATK